MLTVRYFAGARAAAGVEAEQVCATTLNGLLSRLQIRQGGGRDTQRLAEVFAASSLLVDGVVWVDRDAALPAEATVDVLPPFAGG